MCVPNIVGLLQLRNCNVYSLTLTLKPSLFEEVRTSQNMLTFQKRPYSRGLKLQLVLVLTKVDIHTHTPFIAGYRPVSCIIFGHLLEFI